MISLKILLTNSSGNILKDITDYDITPNTGETVIIDAIPYEIKKVSTNYDNNTMILLCV